MHWFLFSENGVLQSKEARGVVTGLGVRVSKGSEKSDALQPWVAAKG